eukprot:364520-Chlamydomonas_euryale.AAC.2
MGGLVRKLWSEEEEILFATGMQQLRRRDFGLMQRKFLPHKTPQQLVSYYYNIWKPRRTDEAINWYSKQEPSHCVLNEEASEFS